MLDTTDTYNKHHNDVFCKVSVRITYDQYFRKQRLHYYACVLISPPGGEQRNLYRKMTSSLASL